MKACAASKKNDFVEKCCLYREKEAASKLCPVCLMFAGCGGEWGRMLMERGKASNVYIEMHVNSRSKGCSPCPKTALKLQVKRCC